MNPALCLRLAAVSGFLAVAFGAFGAHALKDHLDAVALQTFETGVRYQMYHALALLAPALLMRSGVTCRAPRVAAWSFLLGTLLFSGSLYGLSLTGLKWFGPITPLGGVAFLAGWTALATTRLSSAEKY